MAPGMTDLNGGGSWKITPAHPIYSCNYFRTAHLTLFSARPAGREQTGQGEERRSLDDADRNTMRSESKRFSGISRSRVAS